MLVTNQTAQDYWFGPLHLLGGVGQTLTVDDTTATSLYLTEDAVADAINNLYISGKITVSSAAAPFPRPTGVPQLLHGDGSPEGLVFAPEGSVYMRRDGSGANSLYTKTTGVTINTGWQNYTTVQTGPGLTYRKVTAKAVNNTTSATDLLNAEITIGASVLSATGCLRFKAWGDWLQNSGAAQQCPRFQIKLGSTVLFDTGVPNAGASPNNSTTRRSWYAELMLNADNATNAQSAEFDYSLNFVSANGSTYPTPATFTTGEGSSWTTSVLNGEGSIVGSAFTASALDMTVAQALTLNVINAAANTSYETKLYGALVEII